MTPEPRASGIRSSLKPGGEHPRTKSRSGFLYRRCTLLNMMETNRPQRAMAKLAAARRMLQHPEAV